MRYLNANRNVINVKPMYVEREIDGNVVEIALQYQNTVFTEHVLAFANNVHTEEGGAHVTGFRTALTATLNKYARKAAILKEQDPNLTGDDVRDGLTAVISVKLREPQFEGQTKTKLGNSEVTGQVSTRAERCAHAVPRGESRRRAQDHRSVAHGGARSSGRGEGTRPGAAQVTPRVGDAARQAGGLQ